MKVDVQKLRRLDALLENEVEAERLPGAVYRVGIGTQTLWEGAIGYAENRNGIVRPMTNDTVFDLASLTKVMATLPSVLRLVDDGHIRLQDRVSYFIPEFDVDGKRDVTLHQLLTHTSGLITHRDFYNHGRDRDHILQMVAEETLDVPPDTRVAYSDLGFILLGQIVEIVSGQRIDQFAQQNVFSLLGMRETGYRPAPALRPRIAATEEFPDLGVKVGVVHDENTYAMDGVSGHAGLFAPIDDVVQYVQMWLNPEPSVLSPAIRRAAVQCYTYHLAGRRGLGWTCRRDAYDHTGDMWPETTVGHTGFTGTSIAFDPVSQLWVVLLTNGVHYGRESRNIVRLRSRAHNLVAAAIVEF
ncbi:serine hydrolase domain-containing protein [Alicyclobacillus acidiphilus]|uniref:serine hydrolase domain-containing protein n=1 Tax=Alicyclobacillus acidiphilus TaxID=182455 RepID=UPI000836433F|nr:serine hydrolase domain-containing protein [Alicyclobacillus acidiphilus]